MHACLRAPACNQPTILSELRPTGSGDADTTPGGQHVASIAAQQARLASGPAYGRRTGARWLCEAHSSHWSNMHTAWPLVLLKPQHSTKASDPHLPQKGKHLDCRPAAAISLLLASRMRQQMGAAI